MFRADSPVRLLERLSDVEWRDPDDRQRHELFHKIEGVLVSFHDVTSCVRIDIRALI